MGVLGYVTRYPKHVCRCLAAVSHICRRPPQSHVRLDLDVFSPVVDRYLILPTRRGFSRLVLLRLPVRPPTPHHPTRSLLQSLCGKHVSDQRLAFGLLHVRVRLRGSRSCGRHRTRHFQSPLASLLFGERMLFMSPSKYFQ